MVLMKCQGVGHSNVTGAQSGTTGICDTNETQLLATICIILKAFQTQKVKLVFYSVVPFEYLSIIFWHNVNIFWMN